MTIARPALSAFLLGFHLDADLAISNTARLKQLQILARPVEQTTGTQAIVSRNTDGSSGCDGNQRNQIEGLEHETEVRVPGDPPSDARVSDWQSHTRPPSVQPLAE